MTETPDDTPVGKDEAPQYWNIARRRYWHFVLPLFAVWLAGVAISRILPAVYRSGTLILVEEPTVPQQYVVPNVSGEIQNRLDSITQQILSRTRLLRIVSKLGLYANEGTGSTADDVVERMRKDISIELVRSPGRADLTAFNVYFSSRDPRTAQDVTSELTNLFISENLEVRQQQSESTNDFLESQLADAGRHLAQQEARLRDYKNQHLGELPGQLESNIQILAGLQNQLQAEQDALGRAKQQNAYFESLLTQYRSVEMSSQSANGEPPSLPAVDQELNRLRTQLADLKSRYTDDYPDVQKLKGQIAQTEAWKERLSVELKARAENLRNDDGQGPLRADYVSPNQIAPIIEIRGQLKANQLEIANRQEAIKDLKTRIVSYQGRLNQTPVREQQLAEVSRDYEQSKANYDSLLAKKNQSELATNLERRQEGEHFRILDPPSLPTKPVFPNRFKFASVGLFLGLVFGTVSVMAAERGDDHIYTEKQVQRLVSGEVMVQIPNLTTPEEDRKRRFQIWRNMFVLLVIVLCIFAGMTATYVYG